MNRTQALAWLDHFIQHTLPNFGAFEDAMSAGNPRLFHSQLSFALNTKMLHPDEPMRCMRDAIGNSRDNAYAHHIQCLMVIGNSRYWPI